MFVGIDGGGTRARAVLLDTAGAELARVMGPAGIIDARDPARGAVVVEALVRQVLDAAGSTPPCDAVCCGLAGAGREPERQAVRQALEATGVARTVIILGDADVAMADAFPAGDGGVLLIAGTGSIAWARNGAAPALRVGGWGRILGDEGSGYRIGLDALQHVVRAADGRDEPGSLTPRVLAATGCAEPDALVAFADRAAKADIAALAPAVFECAAEADAAARTIVDRAGHALAELAVTAARRASLEAPAVAFAGGLIEAGGPLRAAVQARLADLLPAATLLDSAVDAARGAADLARRAALHGASSAGA